MFNKFCQLKVQEVFNHAFISKENVLRELEACYRHGFTIGHKQGYSDGYAAGVNDAIKRSKENAINKTQ